MASEDVTLFCCWVCNNCKKEFESEEIRSSPDCPFCQSENVSRDITTSDSGKGYEFINLKCKNDLLRSKDKLRREVKSGIRPERDPKSNGRLVEERSIRDRDNDVYKERIINITTGEAIRNCEGPLSQHIGHGSARKENNMKTKGRGIIFFTNAKAIQESITNENYCLDLKTFRSECNIEIANGVAEVTTEKGEKYVLSDGYIIKWIN